MHCIERPTWIEDVDFRTVAGPQRKQADKQHMSDIQWSVSSLELMACVLHNNLMSFKPK